MNPTKGIPQPWLTIARGAWILLALFNPLRRRIQRIIDRRFFRQRYDAEQTLDAFSSAARQETNLEQLSTDLIGTVQQSIQPESVALWIRRDGGRRES